MIKNKILYIKIFKKYIKQVENRSLFKKKYHTTIFENHFFKHSFKNMFLNKSLVFFLLK